MQIQEKKREDKPPSLIFNKHLFGPLPTVLLFFPLTKCQQLTGNVIWKPSPFLKGRQLAI